MLSKPVLFMLHAQEAGKGEKEPVHFDPFPDLPADFGPEVPDEGIDGLLFVSDASILHDASHAATTNIAHKHHKQLSKLHSVLLAQYVFNQMAHICSTECSRWSAVCTPTSQTWLHHLQLCRLLTQRMHVSPLQTAMMMNPG